MKKLPRIELHILEYYKSYSNRNDICVFLHCHSKSTNYSLVLEYPTQASRVGPILFLCFINDLSRIISKPQMIAEFMDAQI